MLHQFGREYQFGNSSTYYGVLSKQHAPASQCLECGQCEAQCPQHINIIENLKLVAATFE